MPISSSTRRWTRLVSGGPATTIPIAGELREAFDRPGDGTIGIEEELMVLDAETLDLTPRADELLASLGADPRLKPELVAAQLELITPPADTVPEAAAYLREVAAD